MVTRKLCQGIPRWALLKLRAAQLNLSNMRENLSYQRYRGILLVILEALASNLPVRSVKMNGVKVSYVFNQRDASIKMVARIFHSNTAALLASQHNLGFSCSKGMQWLANIPPNKDGSSIWRRYSAHSQKRLLC